MPPRRTLNAQDQQQSCSESVKVEWKCNAGQPRCACGSRQDPRQPDVPPELSAFESFNNQLDQPIVAATNSLDARVTITSFHLGVLNKLITFDNQLFDFTVHPAITELNPFRHLMGASQVLED